MKKKPIIGIIATSNYYLTNDSFADTYRYGNNYIKKIVENGAIPYLIPLLDDEVIEDTLDMFDGLLIPGGFKVLPSTFKIIDYFYKNNKPILGICLGMQTLAMYSVNLYTPKRIIKKIDSSINHWPKDIYRDQEETKVHKDLIYKNTLIYDIIGADEISVNSFHNYTITEVGPDFRISIVSEDNLIEGIEYTGADKFVVGVQFHPEIIPELIQLASIASAIT